MHPLKQQLTVRYRMENLRVRTHASERESRVGVDNKEQRLEPRKHVVQQSWVTAVVCDRYTFVMTVR